MLFSITICLCGQKESWKQENIDKAANMIKDMARCAVKVNVCYPFEVVVEIKQEE